MGKKRSKYFDILIYFYIALILLVFVLTNILVMFFTLTGWMLANIIYGVIKSTYKKKYNFRLINDREWSEIANRNLIHYSDVIETNEGESKFSILPHFNIKVNHALPLKDRNKGFVWFHLSVEEFGEEPFLKSFFKAHYFEGDKRKKKAIIKTKNIPRDRLYYDVSTGFYLIEGELNTKILVKDDFKWFNEKVYYNELIISSLQGFCLLWYLVFNSIIVKIQFYFKQKQKISSLQ